MAKDHTSSSEVRSCSCKDLRHLASWTRQLSRKGFKVNKKILKFAQIILHLEDQLTVILIPRSF